MTRTLTPEERERYAGIDTGYISQNIYLYCASAGLATVIHESADKSVLAENPGAKEPPWAADVRAMLDRLNQPG